MSGGLSRKFDDHYQSPSGCHCMFACKYVKLVTALVLEKSMQVGYYDTE